MILRKYTKLYQSLVQSKHFFSHQLFEAKKVRTVWDDEQEKWYFSVVDVVEVLTVSKDFIQSIPSPKAEPFKYSFSPDADPKRVGIFCRYQNLYYLCSARTRQAS